MIIRTLMTALIMGATLSACSQNSAPTDSKPIDSSPYFKQADARMTIDGVDIRYRVEGPSDAPVLVMVHGFTSSLETWDALAAALQNDYRIIRLDLPGHGLSGLDPNADYSNARSVDIFTMFLSALDVDDVTVIGNSLGGLVAWRAALQSPDKIDNLVLISPGGFSINGVTETPVEVPMMVKFYLTKAPSAGVTQATQALYGDPTKLSDTRLTVIKDMMTQPGNGDAFVQRASQFTLPDPADDLAKITAPTLIIWGDKDTMVPAVHGQKFVAAMPNAQLRPYSGIGHVPQEEIPDTLARDIGDFLKSQDTP